MQKSVIKGLKLTAWFSIFLLVFGNAAALSFVSFSGNTIPAQVYETTNANFTFQVSNGLFSLNSVNNVSFQVNGFGLTSVSVINLTGWGYSGFIDYFTTTNQISNWGSQNFGFTGKANNVDSDTAYSWPVIITDDAGQNHVFNYSVTVLNDSTPPAISNIIPTSGSFSKGSASELFSIDAVDPETGVANANVYKSVNCTGNYTQTSLSNSINTWFANLNLAADPEGMQDCYYFDAINNGGAKATTPTYWIIPDRTAPTVNLNSPINGVLLSNSNASFDFTATDNLATTLSCLLTVDSTNTTLNTYNNTVYQMTLADGQHSWNVSCTDGAGWTTSTGTQTFTVDTQGPQINITQPIVQFRGTSVPLSSNIVDAGVGVNASSVTFTVTDPSNGTANVPVAQSGSTFSGSYATTVSSPIGTYQLLVSAADLVNNAANAVMNFIITYSYLLGITAGPSPVNPSDLANNITNNITVNGTITFDDGSAVPENNLTLTIPDINGNSTTVTANIVSNQFTYTLPAPQVAGSYVIFASITPANGYTFNANTTVFVGQFCGDNSCNNGESCGSCAQDCGSCPAPPSGGGGGGGGGSSSGGPAPYIGSGSNAVVPYVEKKQAPTEQIANSASQPVETPISSSNIPQPIAPAPENPGVGLGFALFSKIKAKLWILGIIAGMLLILYIFGWGKKREKSDELSQYIAGRTKYRDW